MKRLVIQITGVIIFTLLTSGISLADPYLTALNLSSSKYKNWSYGSKASKMEIDCVQFVLAVLEEEIQASLNAELRKIILISHGWTPDQTQILADVGKDKRLRGVAYALEDVMKIGKKIEKSEVKAGDFIQYWRKNSKTNLWFGHAAIISEVDGSKVKLYGSHRSKKGIDEIQIDLAKSGYYYITRLNKH